VVCFVVFFFQRSTSESDLNRTETGKKKWDPNGTLKQGADTGKKGFLKHRSKSENGGGFFVGCWVGGGGKKRRKIRRRTKKQQPLRGDKDLEKLGGFPKKKPAKGEKKPQGGEKKINICPIKKK